MAQNTGKSFKDVRKSLYTALIAHAYIPIVDIDGLVTEDVERRFFPAGTAEKVLTSEALTRLFTTISSTGRASHLRLQPAALARLVESRELHVFLAILVTSNCDLDGFSAFTTNLLAPDPWNDPAVELQLPTEDGSRLQDILEDDVAADNFLQKQHEFFAAVIEKNKEVKGHFRRLPYVREKLIGQGSFGKIYDVSISPHHFKSGPMLNEGQYRIARKDFELNAEEKSHEKERDVLRDIVRNAKSHNNIMKSLGSLENGAIYSLFMPLADCDLKQYMQRHPAAPVLPQQKASVVQCAVGLAGAIAYLHEELESPMYEKLSCFHMDLKPQNILVIIDPETQELSWKLSDFNMSRVKMKRKPSVDQFSLRRSSTFSDNVYEINKLFKRRVPDSMSASVTDYTVSRRGTGTYLAPEACIDGHPVQAESDTWSLGCVISVVFSYLYGGQAAVEEYSELRGRKDDVDRFFSFSGGNTQHKLSDAHVSEAVKNWHKHLRMKTRQERPDESEAFEALLSFLDRRVLVVDPKSRRETTAKDIRSKLIQAFNVFHDLEDRGPTSPVSPGSRFNIPILKRWSRRRQSEPETQPQDWKIPFSTASKTCAFGPNAEPLVCMTDSTLTVCSLEHVLLLNASCNFNKDLIVYGEVSPQDKWRHWIPNIGVSSRYIVAATDHKEFDCYFYQITQPGNHNSEVELVAHWELKMPRIKKLAISPDARYVAFVLLGEFTQNEKCSLYITKLDLQYDADQESKYMSIASSSSSSSTSPSSPLGRPIDLPCAAEDVCELTFSDANGLYVVTKPKQHNQMTENTMHVYAWSVQGSGRTPLAPSPIKHDGKDDILRGLYTCFAPYNRSMAFVIVSQEKRVITRAWELGRYTQSNARGCRLLKILLDKNDHDVFAFGTREAHNELQLLTFDTTGTRDELKIRSGIKLPGMTHQSKFVPSISTSSKGTLVQRRLLIAVMEGYMVRIVCVDLEARDEDDISMRNSTLRQDQPESSLSTPLQVRDMNLGKTYQLANMVEANASSDAEKIHIGLAHSFQQPKLHTESSEKLWSTGLDMAERRRLQNRIAQRNYREKLKKRLDGLGCYATGSWVEGEPDLEVDMDESFDPQVMAFQGPSDVVTIACVCGTINDHRFIIPCIVCGKWQHIKCYYNLVQDVVESHKCSDCATTKPADLFQGPPKRTGVQDLGNEPNTTATQSEKRPKAVGDASSIDLGAESTSPPTHFEDAWSSFSVSKFTRSLSDTRFETAKRLLELRKRGSISEQPTSANEAFEHAHYPENFTEIHRGVEEQNSEDVGEASILAHASELLQTDWTQAQNLLPAPWKWDVEYKNMCWTCTPLGPHIPANYPLKIAGSPVVLPVEHPWPLMGGVNPPPDPRPSAAIDSRAALQMDVVRDVFFTFEGIVGFYLLISGLLQLIVPEEFDIEWAASHLPHKYGGLKVCYIAQSLEPTMLPLSTTEAAHSEPALMSTRSGLSSIFRQSRSSSGSSTLPLKLSDFIEARPKGSHRREKYAARVGLKVAKAGEPYLVMSTHVITEAVLAKPHRTAIFPPRTRGHFDKLDDDWNKHVEIWAHNERIGTIYKSFDEEAGIYPNGFCHDITLIKPSTPASIKDVTSPTSDIGWLNRDSWNSLRQQTSTVKILGPTEAHRSAKSVKCSRPSEILVVGEGIFLNQTAGAGISRSLRDHSISTWQSLVSRALLYRVHPDFDPPNGYSGVALYAHGARQDGTTGPGIVGFQSFVQRSGHVQNLNMEGPALNRRLQLGRVAFYGAFEVPEELRRDYTIV